MTSAGEFSVRAVGVVRSTLADVRRAPMQGNEGAPEAWIEIAPPFAEAVTGIGPGDEVVLLTWLHHADRSVLQVHPRDDLTKPLAGVFATRSPDRPNPIGMHRVRVLELEGPARFRVWPLEAVDGTPVLDVKPVIADAPGSA